MDIDHESGPLRVHDKVWIVCRPNGEHHLIEKEPLEGIDAWAKGQHVTVLEYDFERVTYRK